MSGQLFGNFLKATSSGYKGQKLIMIVIPEDFLQYFFQSKKRQGEADMVIRVSSDHNSAE